VVLVGGTVVVVVGGTVVVVVGGTGGIHGHLFGSSRTTRGC
jgi:hypothetical protein